MQSVPLTRLRSLYRTMLRARLLDEQEQELVTRGEAFFHVSGAGHEASAALAEHLIAADYLHCHYRDKALMLARGVPTEMFLLSLLCRAESHSAGRQMSAHMSDRDRHLLSLPGPVGNSALHAVGVAAAIRDEAARPIVLCAVGDGSSQQGEFLEAVAEAVRLALPVLFLIHDNQWSISVPTVGQTFFSRPDGEATEFYGLPIRRVNGWDVPACDELFATSVAEIRRTRKPAIVLLRAERLAHHTNADDQRVYRRGEDLAVGRETRDPLRTLAELLAARGVDAAALAADREAILAELRAATSAALRAPAPQACREAWRPLPPELTDPANEYRGDPQKAELTMRQAINRVLRHHVESDPRVFLYGEDIEDPKGDVFGVTSGLSTLRPAQVANAPLSESTILGTAIGRALAGQRPVAFIQFADFLPLAYNQLASELGSMHWRTQGRWQCPVIVMISCGGYRPGLGPFHAQTLESVAAHTPGVDVAMPADAADAAGMLNAAFRSGRPTLFFYPKNALNDRAGATSADVAAHVVPIGRARVRREGSDLTMVGWGNTVALCLQAAAHLESAGLHAEVIDLRHIAPWDRDCVLASVSKTQRLLIAHEDNLTGGFGAEVAATVAEALATPVRIRRVARPDTYVPCHYANQLELLPSAQRILEVAAELCDAELTWIEPVSADVGTDRRIVHAIGSSPADQTIEIVEWTVREGDEVEPGQLLAEVEGDKAIMELTAPFAGRVTRRLAREGERIAVGQPILELATGVNPASAENPVVRPAAVPKLRRGAVSATSTAEIFLARPCVAKGSRRVGNAELASTFPGVTPDDIFQRTGIEERRWAAAEEDALVLAERATRAALAQHRLELSAIDLLICATGTPGQATPSLACSLLARLSAGASTRVQAYDLNAACSGYLYALQAGHDFLASAGGGKVLIVTAEHLSPLLRKDDFDTAIIFGDAASATLLTTAAPDGPGARLRRPLLSAQGDGESVISVPAGTHAGFIAMRGRTVFAQAVRCMEAALGEVCAREKLALSDLDLIVPHQANQRIVDAIAKRLPLPAARLFSNIRLNGNTSSSSLPLALAEIFGDERCMAAETLGLCAFGGGFTYGAAILDIRQRR